MGYNNDVVIYLTGVEFGRNNNWLRFQARVPALNNYSSYYFEFCGSSIEHGFPLLDDSIECLKEMLYDDFDSPPYSLEKAKAKLGNQKEYVIPRSIQKSENEND
ncbi:MAG: hypothetical protein IKN89_03750 [Oscillospiraceae bacterium]|nr:hypothetical protein [Oscillospiraceae bacterium]